MWLPDDFYTLQTQALKALLRLLPLDAARTEFLALGGPTALLPMLVLQSTMNFHLHSRIVSILATLIITSSSDTPVITQSPSNLPTRNAAIPALVSTLMDEDEVLATSACVVLAALLPESWGAFSVAVEGEESLEVAKLIQQLVSLLAHISTTTKESKSALALLQVLVIVFSPNPDLPVAFKVPPQTPSLLYHNGGIPKIVAYLCDPSPQVREEVVCVLSWLTTDADVRQSIVSHNGLEHLFSQAIHASTLSAQERTLVIISQFAADTANYDANHAKLVSGGAVQIAVHFLGCEDIGVLSLALKAILLLSQHAQCKGPIIAAGGTDWLNMHAQSDTRSIQLASRRALSMLLPNNNTL